MLKRFRQPIIVFILSSVFLHFLAWVAINFKKTRPLEQRPERVEIVIRDSEPDKTASDATAMPQQIVEQDQRLNEEIDDKAKKLSAFNQKVVKQTRAAQSGKFINQASSGQSTPSQSVSPQKAKQKKSASAKGELPSLADLSPKFNTGESQPQNDSEVRPGQTSATDDYLKDVQVGMQTMLSTKEFLYYSYYQRIKDRIRQHWEPTVREKVKMVFRQGRTIASTKDHITQVIITLDKSGTLVRIDVVAPSGVEALDDAAVQAFQLAAPFPNPPKGLIEKDGTIKIRWDFVLEARSLTIFDPNENYAKAKYNETDPSRGL